jgi:hypothetical protein
MQNKRPDNSLHNKNVTWEYVIDTALPHIENIFFPQSPELYEMNILDSNST